MKPKTRPKYLYLDKFERVQKQTNDWLRGIQDEMEINTKVTIQNSNKIRRAFWLSGLALVFAFIGALLGLTALFLSL